MAETKGSSLSMRCFCQSEELSCCDGRSILCHSVSTPKYLQKKEIYESPQNHFVKIQTDQSLTEIQICRGYRNWFIWQASKELGRKFQRFRGLFSELGMLGMNHLRGIVSSMIPCIRY